MNKSLKKINLMGYMVFLKNEHHHQYMKVERIKFKKQKKKEKKAKHESFAIFGEWISGGEESSISSSDESNKRFTTRTVDAKINTLESKGKCSPSTESRPSMPVNLTY